MNSRSRLWILIGGLFLLQSLPVCFADSLSIVQTNVRPQTITPTTTLQGILDTLFGPGALDANSGQSPAGMWQLPGGGVSVATPTLQVSATTDGNTFGIWSGTDTGSITFTPIFLARAASPAVANLVWLPNDPTTISVYSWSGNQFYNSGPIHGINKNAFGFYIEGADTTSGFGGKFWTVDQLNSANGTMPGTPQALSFVQSSTNRWAIAFEDNPVGQAGADYSDLVVTIESITPTPEPASVALLGAVLLGCFTVLRRKVARKSSQ